MAWGHIEILQFAFLNLTYALLLVLVAVSVHILVGYDLDMERQDAGPLSVKKRLDPVGSGGIERRIEPDRYVPVMLAFVEKV